MEGLRDIFIDAHGNALIGRGNELHKQKGNFLRRHELLLLFPGEHQLDGASLGDNDGRRVHIPGMRVLDFMAERELHGNDEKDDVPQFVLLEGLLTSAAISNFVM